MMKFFKIYLAAALFLTGNIRFAHAQNPGRRLTDSLVKKFKYYRAKKQDGVLFAHFDKNIYTNSENVWFTSYLLNNNHPLKNDVLSVFLVKDNDRSIALEEKFVMENGIALGNLFLPDTIASGEYSFILYTNEIANGKPANIFVQPVTIKNTNQTSFNASLYLVDTAKFPAGGKRRVTLVTNTKGTTIIANGDVNFFVGDKKHPLISGNVKTDKAGQYEFSIPVAGLVPGNNILEAEIVYGKEKKTIKLALPVQQDKPIVGFYPEGGTLSDGLMSTVGWEVKNEAGNPCKVKGLLFKDGRPADTINTNAYGMGRFRLLPYAGSRYYVKLLLPGNKGEVYNLPEIKHGPVIELADAVNDDTLKMMIRDDHPETVYVLIHNYKHLFLAFPIKVDDNGRSLKYVLKGLPKGIESITVLDSLQRPRAERLFFAHYNQRNALRINPDNATYNTRQKVTVDFSLQNAAGKPVTGFVSIACIQSNRSQLKKAKDIESYFYLENDLGRLPAKENMMGASGADKAFLEDVLLIKGWRRYAWDELVNTAATDTTRQQDSLGFKGNVKYLDQALKRPAVVVILTDSSRKSITTTANGDFMINKRNLITLENGKIHAQVNGKDSANFNITVTDPYIGINKLVGAGYQPSNYQDFLAGQNDDDGLSLLQHVIRLKQVTIRGDNSTAASAEENACGDYVCAYNILNCPNHRDDPRNKPPVEGKSYKIFDITGHILENIVYTGCHADDLRYGLNFNGIYHSMQFYPADYSQLSPPEPEFLSTIYWKHMLEISPGGNNQVSFYTSDITGTFKIIVQGISENGVVSAEKTIVVNKQ